MNGHSHYRPWEILRMTIPEVVLAIDDDVERVRIPGGGVPMDKGQIREHAMKLRALTPRERMELMREGRL